VTDIYRFGRFELRPATRQVLVDSKPVSLGARAFDLLLALVERRERLVTKNELLQVVWPGLVVEENNLQVQISALRKLLGANAIATVATRGYRFALEPTYAAGPALPSSPSPKHNLPAQTTHLIGREREMRRVREQLSNPDVRLLTLSGVGGTGKTRLALQVATDMMGEFGHGVFFVSLAPLGDPALVVPTIAKTFDLREIGGRPLLEQLQDYLRHKQMLLVLDNFEQVIDAASLVSELLTDAPRLKVLVTSREALRLSGESVFPVPPLLLPDSKRLPSLAQLSQYEAVALFIERAVAVKPSFMVTNENAPAVAEICNRLDGLPLAIELAATRVGVLPPERMLAELSQRLNFLTRGSRDVPARQKTLRGAIDWSHDLLAAAERQLFRRLGVFVGGCTLDSIETVCNFENELNILETMESLIAKSLVKQTDAHGEPRFAMLETIREYAGEKLLAAGEEERVRERHRERYLALAEEAQVKLMGAEQAKWLQQLEDEHDNLRAALNWSVVLAGSDGGLRLCGALVRFWATRGHLTEGRGWCARFLGRAEGEAGTSERAKALNAAGVLAQRQGDCADARARYEESLAIRRQLGDRSGIAGSLNNLANVSALEADYSSARTLYEESLAIRRQLGDRNGIAVALDNLGAVADEQGDLVSARPLIEESLAIMRELGHRGGIADALNNLGTVVTGQGDYAGGWALHEQSLVIRRELGDVEGTARSLEGLAAVVAALGSPLRAARIWGAAERIRAEVGLPLSPTRPDYHRRVAAARTALGDDIVFERGWQEGRALTMEQAIELTLKKIAD
jgi:predicted ATPase/DNA-binding winged helix-turn-helix (wHTH) protein